MSTLTVPIVAKAPNAKYGPLNIHVDDWRGAHVQASGANQRFDSITATGSASGVFASGSTDLSIGFLDTFNATARMYCWYAGGDKATVGARLRTLLAHVISGPDPKTTDDDSEHGIRAHNARGCAWGDMTLNLNVPAAHPGYGFSGYILHDSQYGGSASTIKETILAAEELKLVIAGGDEANKFIERVRNWHQRLKLCGAVGAGPLKTHLDNPTRSAGLRNSERGFVGYEQCELHVGKRYLEFSAACDARTRNCKVFAADGAGILNTEGPRVSKDGLAKWVGSTSLHEGTTFIAQGGKLFTDVSKQYLHDHPDAATFVDCKADFGKGLKSIGAHGET